MNKRKIWNENMNYSKKCWILRAKKVKSWFCMIWYDSVWYDMIWFGMIWFDIDKFNIN